MMLFRTACVVLSVAVLAAGQTSRSSCDLLPSATPVPASTPAPTPVPTILEARTLAGGEVILPNNLCPSAFLRPTIYQMQDQMGTNSSYLVDETSASIGTNANQNPVSLNSFSTDVGKNVAGGVYTIDYVVRDTCFAEHRTTATMDFRCAQPLTIDTSDLTITVQAGAEVLFEAVVTRFSDDFDFTPTICVKSVPTAAPSVNLFTVTGVKKFLRTVATPSNEGIEKVMYGLTPWTSGDYVFTITATDGCQVIQKDITVTVTLDDCSGLNKPYLDAGAVQTVVWDDTSLSSYQKPISISGSQSYECLPKDYQLTSSLSGINKWRDRYSPFVAASTTTARGNARLLNNAEYNTVHAPAAGAGCTWPGAINYDANAQYDNGGCMCPTNNYEWRMVDTTGTYNRWYPTSPSIPPVLSTNQSLVFYNSRPQSNASTPEVCKRTSQANSFTPYTERDLRIDATEVRRGTDYISAGGAVLERPSTSWDAKYQFRFHTVAREEWYSVTNVESSWDQNDIDCTIELVSSPGTTSSTNTLKVTKGPGKSFRQCLGRYSFKVRSVPDLTVDPIAYKNFPASDEEEAVVSVICPHPPFVQTLCHQDMLWNGTSFVRTSEVGTMDGWIQIDARDSYYPATSASITTAWKIVSAPPMVTFNGAGPSGGEKAVTAPVDLGNTAVVQPQGTGADDRIGLFKPTRGGQYDVSYSIDDGCNTPSFDNVTVMTECLRMTANPSILSTDAFEGPATTGATTTTKALVRIQPDASYEGPNRTLNYAWRLSSRPTFMGDSVPGGAFANLPATWPVNAGMAVGAECMLGENWDTQTIDRTLTSNFSLWLSTEVSLPIAGTYRFDQYVTDGCGMEKQTGASLSTTVSCGADTVDFSKDATQPDVNVSVWNGAGFTVRSWPTFEASATAGRHPTRYSFFLTAVPALDTAHVPFAGGSANTNGQNTPKALASDQQCDPWGNTWAVGAMSGAVAAASSPTAPFKILTGQSGSSKPKLGLTDMVPNAVGSYEVYLQGDNECSYVPKLYASFKTECNKPARLVCLATGETSTTSHLPMPSGNAGCASGDQVNGMTGGCIKGAAGTCDSQLAWDCVNARFPTSWINVAADSGSDFGGFSQNDIVTATTTLTAPSANSWLSVEYVKYTATWTIRVRDTALDSNPNTNTQGNRDVTLADGSGFSELLTQLTNGLPAKIAAAASAGGYTVPEARVTGVNVSIVDQGVGCFVPYWGRLFKVQADFYMLPPAHFAAPVTGQQAPFTAGADVRPYSTFISDFTDSFNSNDLFYKMSMAAPNAEYFTGNRDAIPMSAQPGGSLNGTLSSPSRFPRTLSERQWAVVPIAAGAPVRTASSWYIPDLAGQYESTVSVSDNCPCTGADCPSQWAGETNTMTYVATARDPSCQLLSQPILNVTNFKTGQELAANPSFQWISPAKGFGDGWQYAGQLAAQTGATDADRYITLAVSSTLDDWTVQCINANTPASVACVTSATGAVNVGAVANVGSIARIRTATPTGAGASRAIIGSNGATITFSVTGPLNLGNAPLQLGCMTDAAGTIALSSVRFFASVTADSTTVAKTYTFPIPDQCKVTSVDFVFYRAAYIEAAEYAVTAVSIKEHTAGVQLSPTCAVTYEYNSDRTPGAPFGTGDSTAQTLTEDPTANLHDANGNLVAGGMVGQLPSSGITPTLTFRAAEVRPTWLTNPSCAQSSDGDTIGLRCRSMSLTTDIPASLTFEGPKFQFPSATAQTTAAYTIATTDMDGLTYTYTITSAPEGSIYNKQWIADNLAIQHLPAPSSSEKCFLSGGDSSDLTYTYDRLGGFTTDVTITSNLTSYSMSTVDVDTISVTLVNRDYPDKGLPSDNGKAQLKRFLENQEASTCFQPDVAGTYLLHVSVSDGCQTLPSPLNPMIAQGCPVPNVVFSSNAGTVSGATLTGVQSLERVDIHAAIGGADTVWATNGQNTIRNATWVVHSWPKSTSTFAPEVNYFKPALMNAGSLYPSFVPERPGTYVLHLYLDTGCLPALQPYPLTITVGCTPAGTPSPVVSMFDSDEYSRAATTPNRLITHFGYAGETTTELVGVPGCHSWLQSFFDSTSLTWAPPTDLPVYVKSIDPPILSSAFADGEQYAVVTLGVGQMAAGLPQFLLNPLYHNENDDNAVVIELDGDQCDNPVVIDYTAGTIGCWFSSTPSTPGTYKLTATILSVKSTLYNGDLEVSVAQPYVTHTSTPAGAPVWGGTVIQVHGYNLAVDRTMFSYFDASRTVITIGGNKCTGVALGMASRGPDGYLTCTLPEGFGTNLPVVVTMAFTEPWDGPEPSVSTTITATAYAFSYDGPVANPTTLSPATGLGAGGYMATVQVSNMGPRDRFDQNNVIPSSAGGATPNPYDSVKVYVDGNMATDVTVTADETSASSPATVSFRMPAGCGDAARVEISREESRTMASQTTATFNYDDPVVLCLGEPYTDPSGTGCTQVVVDGRNLYIAPGFKVEFLNKDTGDVTDTCDGPVGGGGGFDGSQRFTCRVGSNASPTNTMRITNSCGETNTVTNADNMPALPNAVSVPSFITSVDVSSGSSFDTTQTTSALTTSTEVSTVGGAEEKWKDQPMSNGLFIGLGLPLIIIVVLAYPVYVYFSRRNAGTAVRQKAFTPATSGAGAGAGAGTTRITRNPAARAAPARTAAPATSASSS